jgi:hypothetical protein
VVPKISEAIAAIHAVQSGIEAGFKNVIFEGDPLQLIQDLHMDSPLLNTTGHYVDSIKHMHEFFICSTFVHCKREANGVAHSLAN